MVSEKEVLAELARREVTGRIEKLEETVKSMMKANLELSTAKDKLTKKLDQVIDRMNKEVSGRDKKLSKMTDEKATLTAKVTLLGDGNKTLEKNLTSVLKSKDGALKDAIADAKDLKGLLRETKKESRVVLLKLDQTEKQAIRDSIDKPLVARLISEKDANGRIETTVIYRGEEVEQAESRVAIE